jgi:hypothetical protein
LHDTRSASRERTYFEVAGYLAVNALLEFPNKFGGHDDLPVEASDAD